MHPSALLEPFTPAMAARSGIGRSTLERLLRQGRIIRILRGVYLGAEVEPDRSLRARALSLVIGGRQLVVDRTAAWVHGGARIEAAAHVAVPLDLHGRRRHLGTDLPLGPEDVVRLGPVQVTAPLRTALDVARRLAPDRALAALDGMIRSGSLEHGRLLAAAGLLVGLPGARQGRELIAMADARAVDGAESVLRLCWSHARVPTPVPGLVVNGHRLALALPTQRFAVSLDAVPAFADWPAPDWRVLALDRRRVLAGDRGYLSEHLEREFHQHLLLTV
ncbi:MAG: type IV toxin-antitoxin system AbiEi family antitoxin domain-containing protein [Marmoricola sp.]